MLTGHAEGAVLGKEKKERVVAEEKDTPCTLTHTQGAQRLRTLFYTNMWAKREFFSSSITLLKKQRRYHTLTDLKTRQRNEEKKLMHKEIQSAKENMQ